MAQTVEAPKNLNIPSSTARERPPDVSVLIVSWNSEPYIRRCLRSINSAANKHTAEVILVDNGSSDLTLQVVHQNCPEVHVIETRANLGFARAVNVGSRHAIARYMFLLNPDTELLPDSIDKLVDFLELHPDAGAVSPRILDKSGGPDTFAVRQFPSLLNTIFRQFGLRRLFPGSQLLGCETLTGYDRRQVMVVPCVSGAAIMLPKTVFEAAGGLDEDLPMYFEDLELCARVGRIAPIYYFPQATVVHLGRKSAARSSARSVLVAMENGEAPWMYLRRYSGLWHARAFSAIVFIGSLARFLVRGSLLFGIALLGRGDLELAYSRAADTVALLKWCVMPRRTFLSVVNSIFPPSEGVPIAH